LIACLSIAGGRAIARPVAEEVCGVCLPAQRRQIHHGLKVLKAGQLPRLNRLEPWQCDRALYHKRNEIDRLFLRLKGFRRIFSRFDKIDVAFLAFISFVLIVEGRR
jgi:transposase